MDSDDQFVTAAGGCGDSLAKTSPSGACRCDGFVRWTRTKYTAPTSVIAIAVVQRIGWSFSQFQWKFSNLPV